MLRKFLIASVIAAAAIAAVPTDASARRGGGFYRGWYGPAFIAAPVYTCWRTVRVGTPYGWRWRRVWVCG